jgi:dephospho-CoA kinase
MISSRLLGFCGGIACGKTSRCERLLSFDGAAPPSAGFPDAAALRVRVISSDIVAHECYARGTPLSQALVTEFGDAILTSDGIDRRALGALVFGSEARREKLNGLVWPCVTAEVAQRVARMQEAARADGVAWLLVVVEAALLLEAEAMATACDEVWLAQCAPDVALRRVAARDGFDAEQSRRRIESQPTVESRVALAQRLGIPHRVFDTDEAIEVGLEKIDAALGDMLIQWRTSVEQA